MVIKLSNRIKIITFLFFICSLSVQAASKPFHTLLLENAKKGSPEEVLLAVVSEYLSDNEEADKQKKDRFAIDGREAEADQILDTLVRIKGAVPILIGAAGVGKTTTVVRAAQKMIDHKYPENDAFSSVLKDSAWISTSPGRIMRLVKTNNPAGRMAAIEDLFDAVLKIEAQYDRKIVLYIDEIHSLDPDQVEAMLPYLDSTKKGVRLVGSTNSDKFQNAFKDNDAWLRRVHLIGLEEFDQETTLRILKKWWLPFIEKKYEVRFQSDALEAAVQVAPNLIPEAGRFDASIKTLQDLAIRHVRDQSKEDIKSENVYAFAKDRTGFPVNPHNAKEIVEYIEKLKQDISKEVIDQPRMIEDTVSLFQTVAIGTKKGLGVGLIIGPTGTGKSELGVALARLAFKNAGSFLRIDANEYKNGSFSLNKLFGAEGGLVTSNDRSGILPEFLDDPSRGKYGGVILIDEGERAHPDFWERLMEFLDTGSFVGGDGRRRNARRHLVLITSNRGDRILFPEAASAWSENELKSRMDGLTPQVLKNLFLQKITGTDEFNLPVPVLNRIDTYTAAQPILIGTSQKIIAKLINDFSNETKNDFHITMQFDESVISHLGALDYTLRDGARPIINRANHLLKDLRIRALSKLKLSPKSVVKITLDESDSPHPMLVATVGDNTEDGILKMDLPVRKIEDPLLDPVEREKLRNLSANLKKNVIGQDQIIESLSRAITAQRGNAKLSGRPVAAFLIGPTGVGKTWFGKALAEALYGSADRAEVISLGKISSHVDFTKIFGSSPGYIGSDKERVFETALINNPSGGVLIWDEASNMGGNDQAVKEACFKVLYDLVEVGFWVSPSTGVKYDLSKYFFLFTGNDGEEYFTGATNDDLRLAIWKRNNSRGQVRDILIKHGVPEAFVGRMADVLFAKPLMREETTQIVKAQLDPVLKAFAKRGVKVDLDAGFIDAFSNAFFSQSTGARSLRNVLENRVRGLLTSALIELDFDPTLPAKPSFALSIEDKETKRPYRRRLDLNSSVHIIVESTLPDGTTKTFKEDLSEYADRAKKLPLKQALKTAYHEAGHAVANDPLLTGTRLRYVTILGSKGNLGYASYEDVQGDEHFASDRRAVLSQMSRLIAGQLAMVMAGFEPDSGWSSDLSHVRQLATRYLRDWGLGGKFHAAATGDRGKPELTSIQKSELVKEQDSMIREATKIAEKRLTQNWPLVRRLVRDLLTNGGISGEEFDVLRADFEKKTLPWVKLGKPKRKDCEELLLGNGKVKA